jgi:hypothetical protein
VGEDSGDDDENDDEFADADGDADGDGDEAAESGEARRGGECCREEEEEEKEEGRKADVPTPRVSGEIERRCGIRDRRADADDDEEDTAVPALPLAWALAFAWALE